MDFMTPRSRASWLGLRVRVLGLRGPHYEIHSICATRAFIAICFVLPEALSISSLCLRLETINNKTHHNNDARRKKSSPSRTGDDAPPTEHMKTGHVLAHQPLNGLLTRFGLAIHDLRAGT